jgi:hypothetical protein
MDLENLTPDTMLPEQFADLRKSRGRDGYSRLWLALLEDAVRVVSGRFSGNLNHKVIIQQAWDWIENTAHHPCSFNFVCEGLEINPETLRAQLLRFREAGQFPKVSRGRSVSAPTVRLRGKYERRG